jgi:hypothetical protein
LRDLWIFNLFVEYSVKCKEFIIKYFWIYDSLIISYDIEYQSFYESILCDI